jgi:hypothetical protein
MTTSNFIEFFAAGVLGEMDKGCVLVCPQPNPLDYSV